MYIMKMNTASRAISLLLLAMVSTTFSSDDFQEWDGNGRIKDAKPEEPSLPPTTTKPTTSTSSHGDLDVPPSNASDEESNINSTEIDEHVTPTTQESSTASVPTTITTTTASCECRCHVIDTNETISTDEQTKRLKAQTTTPKQQTSAHKMSLVSANDRRSSSRYIGVMATAIIAVLCGLIVVSDIMTCFRFL